MSQQANQPTVIGAALATASETLEKEEGGENRGVGEKK